MKTDVLVVLTTVGSEEQANQIASTLVDESLAACVNILGDVKSVYRWKGKVAHDEERLLIIKTTAPLFDTVRRRIKALHSYELPEIIALSVEAGDDGVLDWIKSTVAAAKPR